MILLSELTAAYTGCSRDFSRINKLCHLVLLHMVHIKCALNMCMIVGVSKWRQACAQYKMLV
jgi:hypothetical protein